MGRDYLKHQLNRTGHIPTKDFQEVLSWLHRSILDIVSPCGVEGIEAHDAQVALDKDESPVGWAILGPDRASSQFWRVVRRLSKRGIIQEFHSNALGHNRSRVRIRMSVLDRFAHELGDLP